jgi:cytoskeletal protein CcmA (bactofilin family)
MACQPPVPVDCGRGSKEKAMNRLVSVMALAALGLATISGCTFSYDGDEAVSHQFGSDYFGAGGIVNLTDPVEGDAFIAGGQVSIASEVSGDLVVAGGEVSVGGGVGDDLYAAGGNVKVDAIVRGNARVAGGDVAVGPATVIAGATSLTGARIEFEGNSHGYLQASGASVHLSGEVLGDAEIRSEDLVIEPGTQIRGRLIYHGPTAPVVPQGALISGGVEFHEAKAGRYMREPGGAVRETVHWVGTVLWHGGVFVAAVLFLMLFPGFSTRAAEAIGRDPLRVLGLGLAILVCVPFVAVILVITIIGIPLALLVIPLYLLLLFLGWVTAALFIGQRGLSMVRPGQPATLGLRLLALFLALVALGVVKHVPLVGGLIGFLALIAGIGALVWQGWSRREQQAPATG